MIPEFNYRWEFPYRRFVQFEKKDEWWARKMGFGREVKDRVVYQIGDVLFMHPKTLEAFNAAANLQTARPQA